MYVDSYMHSSDHGSRLGGPIKKLTYYSTYFMYPQMLYAWAELFYAHASLGRPTARDAIWSMAANAGRFHVVPVPHDPALKPLVAPYTVLCCECIYNIYISRVYKIAAARGLKLD